MVTNKAIAGVSIKARILNEGTRYTSIRYTYQRDGEIHHVTLSGRKPFCAEHMQDLVAILTEDI